MPLLGIPANISPQLLHTLASMGHGDYIVLADANFPSYSVSTSTHTPLIREDGQAMLPLLQSILSLLPLDTYDTAVYIMDLVPSDKEKGLKVPIVAEYGQMLKESLKASNYRVVSVCDTVSTFKQGDDEVLIAAIERSAFYDFARNAFAVVATGETAIYANIILRKGVITK